jgi:uncharacterized protein
MLTPRRAEFVIKITKYCNLRCSYCYEFPDLGKKERIPLDAIERMFRNVASDPKLSQLNSLEFIWHGGEPFLVPLDYYEAIGALQREIFTDKFVVSNTVQTNLTVLTDRHVALLKSKTFFSSLGVSFDVYGDQRVDVRGRPSTQTVLANLQTLIDNEIEFGVIVVLARNTLPHVRQIIRFFDGLKIGMRFLPFYLNAGEKEVADWQIANHALSYSETIEAFKQIFDEWLASPNAIPVDPIDSYIDFAIGHLSGLRDWTYLKSEIESVFVVNIDGSVWGASEAYVSGKSYGNLFDENFTTILNSSGRRMVVNEAESRIAYYCGQCPYHGACPGHYVGDASPQQQRMLAQSGCPVRELIGYIVEKFEQTGLSDVIAERAGQRRQEKKTHLVSL